MVVVAVVVLGRMPTLLLRVEALGSRSAMRRPHRGWTMRPPSSSLGDLCGGFGCMGSEPSVPWGLNAVWVDRIDRSIDRPGPASHHKRRRLSNQGAVEPLTVGTSFRALA